MLTYCRLGLWRLWTQRSGLGLLSCRECSDHWAANSDEGSSPGLRVGSGGGGVN